MTRVLGIEPQPATQLGAGPDAILGLQRSAGNAAVSRHLAPSGAERVDRASVGARQGIDAPLVTELARTAAARSVARCSGGDCRCGGACRTGETHGVDDEEVLEDLQSQLLARRTIARCADGSCHCGGACRQPHEGAEDALPAAPSSEEDAEHDLRIRLRPRDSAARLQRWALGGAPAPAGWTVVTDPDHVARVAQAEASIRGVLASRNCQNYFGGTCTNGAGPTALQQAFNNATVYHRAVDDNEFGASINGTSNIAYNLRSFRIGKNMMASTLLHEMFHTCDPTLDANDELDAENAVEACRMHTPWIDTVNPRSGGAGTRVTIVGWGFGARQQAVDEVRIGGMAATIASWVFLTDNTSRVRIVAEVPASSGAGAGAGAGSDLVVINNGVSSNAIPFTIT